MSEALAELGAIQNGWTAPLVYVVAFGIAGILVWRLIPKRLAIARLFVQIAFFLSMSAMFIGGSVTPYEPVHGDETTAVAILVGSAKLLWWVHLAWALIGLVRIYLVFERQPREARFLQDLVVGVVYVTVSLSVLAFVFAMPVGTLIATSGVFAIILGLALQNTLSDLFSGVALNLGRPYVLGDWIVLSDGTEGRVVETNWRSTYLLTTAHNVIALPNSLLARLGVTNISSPDESHGLSVLVRLAPTRIPAAIVDVMLNVLSSSNSILKQPSPLAMVRSLDASAIEIELSFRVANLDKRIEARNEIFDLVYRHLKAAGLVLAMPPSASIAMSSFPTESTPVALLTPIELFKTIPMFAVLTQDEQIALAAKTSVRNFHKGDIIARQGEMLSSLMVIQTGIVARLLDRSGGKQDEVGRLAPGDFFGETGLLTSQGETATLLALSRVTVYVIDQQSFGPLLVDRPEMAEDLAAILSSRASVSDGSDLHDQHHARSRFALLKAIRASFSPFRSSPVNKPLQKTPLQD